MASDTGLRIPNGHRGKVAKTASLLRAMLDTDAYAPGALLPAERQLAAQLGIARNTLRKALFALEAEGLLRHEKHRGFLCAEPLAAGFNSSFLLAVPSGLDPSVATLSLEAMALVGSTLCACAGSDLNLQLHPLLFGGTKQILEQWRTGHYHGVLLVECRDEEMLNEFRNAGVYHVIINQEKNLPGPATRVDFHQMGRLAARHFIKLGHSRLGMLSGPATSHQAYERMLAGFRGRCAEEDLYLDPQHVACVPSSSEDARIAALTMLSSPNRPTALFCGRDIRAHGAYLATRELGLRVPEDISLIGYDNITWPGDGREFLTTFPEPTAELGRAAVNMLIEWIQTGDEPADKVICPKLVVRQSTAPPTAD